MERSDRVFDILLRNWKSGVPDLGHDAAFLTELFRVISQSLQGCTVVFEAGT
jgi:hypothetical protein